ncbi:calponin homology domain-containing protein DDB_G0272472-like [Harpegnathos saltator]|uniref:calponin homology domain-containing protein DDB_G0272472-like n=1 Tax=Harpegnathos saltator TaxID=610380 RepID=UPI000DBEDD27|nr:calponin homology domain-containing protein DDB_G0272472-like [Harpegnathos saltator]
MSLGSEVPAGQGTPVPGASKPGPLCTKKRQRESAPNKIEGALRAIDGGTEKGERVSGARVGGLVVVTDILLSQGSRYQVRKAEGRTLVQPAAATEKKRGRPSTSGGSTTAVEIVEGPDPVLVPEQKKRGRPPTAGLGVGIKERKEKEGKDKKEERLRKLEREAWNLMERGICQTLADKRPNEEVFKDGFSMGLLRGAGSAELADEMGRTLGAVGLVAKRCNTKEPRVAAQEGEGAERPEVTRELDDLWESIRALRVENQKLQEELQKSRAREAHTQPPQPEPVSRSKTYAEVTTGGASTSAEEEGEEERRRKMKRKTPEGDSLSGAETEPGKVRGDLDAAMATMARASPAGVRRLTDQKPHLVSGWDGSRVAGETGTPAPTQVHRGKEREKEKKEDRGGKESQAQVQRTAADQSRERERAREKKKWKKAKARFQEEREKETAEGGGPEIPARKLEGLGIEEGLRYAPQAEKGGGSQPPPKEPEDRSKQLEEVNPASSATREEVNSSGGDQEEKDSSLASWGIPERTSTLVQMEKETLSQRKRRGDERKKEGTSGSSEEDYTRKVRRVQSDDTPPTTLGEGEAEGDSPPSPLLVVYGFPSYPPKVGEVQVGTLARQSPSVHNEAQVVATKAEAPSEETEAVQPPEISQEGVKVDSPEEACKA